VDYTSTIVFRKINIALILANVVPEMSGMQKYATGALNYEVFPTLFD
jgi:hypothetical protein